MRVKLAGLIAVALISVGGGLASHSLHLLSWLQRDSVDARFSLRGQRPAPASVAIVGIDNDSLGSLPRYPFSRAFHAKALEYLHAAGARLIVDDISFDRPSTQTADLALFEAARRSAPVVFATSLISPTGKTQVLGGDANLASIGARAAAADLRPDADGVLRHTVAEVNGLPSIASAVASALGRTARAKQLAGGWIDFPGPPGTIPQLSFAKVVQDHFARSAVRGRVVVIGATAPVLQDEHSTAAGSPMSGPEVQAGAIATALAGFPLRSPSDTLTVLLILALALAVPLASLRLGALGCCLTGLALGCAWCGVNVAAFDGGTVLEFGDPLVGLLAGTAGTIVLGSWVDGREHRRLRELFAAGEEAVVDRVLNRPGERSLEPTAVIAGYRLEEVIGRGGMGIVYRAVQLELERAVALKLIATERASDPYFRDRFRLESKLAAAVEHANVIPVYEAGDDDGLLFIAMRLVDGVDLGRLVASTGLLSDRQTVRLMLQLAGALDAAHTRGLVHRDVKPANVLLTVEEPQHAYLTDFGLARQVQAAARVTRAGELVGTLDYMSPEQINGQPATAASDIYALAGVMFHCLTGSVPYPRDSAAATMWAHVSAAPPAITERRPELPIALDELVARGMAKAPEERFATATDLARALASALDIETAAGLGPVARARPPASAAERPASPPAPTVISS